MHFRFGHFWSASVPLVLACSVCNADILRVRTDAPPGGDGASWATAFNSLHTALGTAVAGDQIWLAAGDYKPAPPNGDRSISFVLVSGVEVYGGFAGDEDLLEERDYLANVTRLSGDLNSNDVGGVLDPSRNENSNRLVSVSNANSATVLDGVTLIAGQANGPIVGGAAMFSSNSSLMIRNCTVTLNLGIGAAGIACGGPNGPTFDNCTFSFNRGTGSTSIGGLALTGITGTSTVTNCRFIGNQSVGGGTAIRLQGTSAVLTQCNFEDNISTDSTPSGGAGGVYQVSGQYLTAQDCTFEGNHGASGGAIAALGAAIIERCIFDDNSCGNLGGGAVVLMSSLASPIPNTLVDCVFRSNSATAGGGAVAIADGNVSRLTNCLFTGNTSTCCGGAIVNDAAPLTLVNCTMSGNSANNWGGALHTSGGTTVISNCAVWGNTTGFATGQASQINKVGSATIQLNYSCVQHLDGTLGGLGNIGSNPLFVDADGSDNVLGTPDDNARLGAGSPAIDAGTNAAVPVEIVLDLDGNPRRTDDPSTPDTGAGRAPIVDMGCYEFAPPQPCIADIDGSDAVEINDLLEVINNWGACLPPCPPRCAADIDPIVAGDCQVNINDLLAVINSWGPCP